MCYLPTNTCKDQLSFSRERAECSSSAECGDHEVCYTPDKVGAVQSSLELAITTCGRVQKCVCELGAIESYGQCVPLQSLDCGDTLNLTKVGHCSTAALQHCSTGTSPPHCAGDGHQQLGGVALLPRLGEQLGPWGRER